MIAVKNLQYKYPNGKIALKDIDVIFPGREIFAILGESGSGKTTLLKLLGRFIQPQKGCIEFDGTNISKMSEKNLRAKIGFVFQKLYLFPHLNVLENMTLALRKVYGKTKGESNQKAELILERLGISDLIKYYPSQISGGQAQRVAIARGLVLEPGFMLLDEPTSALDANTTDNFAEWLIELNEKQGGNSTNFIIVTHDILFAQKAAKCGVYLSNGSILDNGDIDTIIQHVQAGQITETK